MPQEVLLNKKDTAYMMGVSTAAFDKWNIAPVGKKGRETYYDLKQVIAWKLEKAKSEGRGAGDLTAHRSRYIKAKAEREELRLATEKGSLIPDKVVEIVWGDQVSHFRAKLLTMPNKSAKILADTSNPMEVEAMLRDYVHEALDELSDYTTEQYRINTALTEEDQPDGGEAAVGDVDKPVGGRKEKAK